jgi:hypothetical protein
MSGFKGTPGPWAVSYADNPNHGSSWGGYWQIDDQYDAVACNQSCFAGINKPDVSEANARLLAAAPDLLEALQELYHAYCSETGFAAAVRMESGKAYPWEPGDIAEAKALAAISRALGEGENA